MREIKFRAWHRGQEKLYDMVTLSFDIPSGQVKLKAENPQGFILANMRQLEIQQFTGCKDKNGVDGYAGDEASKSGAIWTIVWNDNDGCWQLANDLYPPLPIRKLKEMIILGNIYKSYITEE